MKTVGFIALATLAMICTFTPSAFAASAHTWVAAEGSDSNTGTRLSPFLTLQHAIDNTNAGGEVSFVDTGDYGSATIAHSITIDGGGVRGGISFSGANGIAISAGNTDQVVHRTLDISGNGVGQSAVFIFSALSVTIDNCTI